MLNLIEAIILGVIQGITEWLPISSTAHLEIVKKLLKVELPILFDVFLHLGTLIVLILIFNKEIKQIIKSIIKLDYKSEHFKLFQFLILGSIPITVIGLLFYKNVELAFTNSKVIGYALIINGIILFLTKFINKNKPINKLDSLIIGFSQAIAIIPGISRSGITISTGLLKGINKTQITTFSFLLSIPAILGATILELKNITYIPIIPTLVGTLTSMISGYIALKLIIKLIKEQKFYKFSYYSIIMGILVLLFI